MSNSIYRSAYTAAQIEAAIGKGPRVNASGYWEVWNVSTGAYESTGVGAGVKPPTVVTQASQMTNHGYIYIYNGSETGYTPGYWYYWDGTAWTAGGAYQSAPVDPTLSVAGAAADAKATGEVTDALQTAIGNEIIDITWGYYITTNGSTVNINSPTPSTTGWGYAVVDAAEGDVFTVNSPGASTIRAWCFIDASGNSLSVAGVNVAAVDKVIVAPANTAKLVVNTKPTSKPSFRGRYIKNDVQQTMTSQTYDEYLINDGSYTIQASDLESGQWLYSTKSSNAARARTKYLLPVRAGMQISYSNTTFDTYFGVLATPTSSSYIQTPGWKTDGSGIVYIIRDGYLTFNIRNHADNTAAVDPAAYNSTVTIQTAIQIGMYNGRDPAAVSPRVLAFYSTAALTSFGLSDMPKMSYTYTDMPSKFTDIPSDFTGGTLHVEKISLNVDGALSMAVVINPANPDVRWVARLVGSETLTWTKCVTRSEFDSLYDFSNSFDRAVYEHNTINVPLAFSTYESYANRGGVEYTLDDDGYTYTIDGEGTATTWVEVANISQSLNCLMPGRTYNFVLTKTTGIAVQARVYYVVGGSVDYDHPVIINVQKAVTIPSNFEGCLIRIYGRIGSTYNEDHVSLQILSQENNGQIDDLKNAVTDLEDYITKNQHISRINPWPLTDMATYSVVDGEVVMDENRILGSDFIKCPKWLVCNYSRMNKSGNESIFAANSTPESNVTMNGITFTLNADKNEYTINGSNTLNSVGSPSYATVMTVAQSTEYLEAGKSYYMIFDSDCSAVIRIYYKVDGSIDYDHPKDFRSNGVLTIPGSFSGCLIRVYANGNTQYTDAKVYFELLTPATYTENNDPRMYIYFYNKVNGEYVRNDDILYHVTDPTNLVNYFSPAILGNRVLEIPDNTYVQFSDTTGQDFVLYGWDGVHVGCEMCGNAYTSTVYNNGETTIVLPGSTSMVWSKSYATKAVYGEPVGIPGALDLVYTNAGNVGRMCVPLPSGYNFFVVRFKKIVPLTANTKYFTLLNEVHNGNLNDEISCFCDELDYCTVPSLRAAKIIKAARDITEGIEWVAQKKVVGYTGTYSYYKDVRYGGVPYAISWDLPNSLGYHISKQTLINAANDVDSAFYTETSHTGKSPGYGLVCSTFAELCCGWPYPMATNELGHNPDVVIQYTDGLIPGAVLWNDGGHIVLPEMVFKSGDTQGYIVYEGVNPSTTRVLRLDKRNDPNFYAAGNGEFITYEYLQKYIYACTHKQAKGYPYNAYNIYAGQLINGTARPYRGDRCVMTNLQGVKINIKDANATKLYLQKCTRSIFMTITTPTDYLGDRFLKTNDSPIEINITGNQMTIDPALLDDGAFYGCYTDADSTMEYFEYHNVTAGTYSKTSNNFVFNVDRPFWYVAFDGGVEQYSGEVFRVTIPYMSSGDYQKYRQALNPHEGADAFAFVRGTLGAYVIPMTQV